MTAHGVEGVDHFRENLVNVLTAVDFVQVEPSKVSAGLLNPGLGPGGGDGHTRCGGRSE